MSVDRHRTACRIGMMLLVGLSLCAQRAWAGSWSGGIPDLLDDPLLTRPPILDKNAVLPGDNAPLNAIDVCAKPASLPQPLMLIDAVDLALCQDPRARAAWADIKMRAAGVGQARGAYLPTLSGSVSDQRNATTYPDFPANNTAVRGYSNYATLNWRLFDFGERAANRIAANDMLAAAQASYAAALQKTLTATVQAYFDGLTTQAAYRARMHSAQLADQILEAARRREARGATGRSDTLQAQTALARAQLAQQRAAGDANKALATLAFALGGPMDVQIVLPQDADAPAKQQIADLTQWMNVAQQLHPAIVAARRQWDADVSKIDSARSEGMPTVDFGMSVYQNGYPNQSVQATRSKTFIVGVTVTIPLFEGFTRTYKIREAQAQAEHSQAMVDDTERETLAEVVKVHADALMSLANLDASETLLAAANTALASSRNRYEHGATDILELLNAQSGLADARQERIRCESEWRSARLRLMAAAGVLGRQGIVDNDVTAPDSRSPARLQP